MPTTTMLISAQTLTSASASVTFSSIPQTFTDLKLVYSTRVNTSGAPDLAIQFNGVTSNQYSWRLIHAYQSSSPSAYSGSGTTAQGLNAIEGGNSNNATTTSNTFTSSELYIPNYLSSNYKSTSLDSTPENNGTDTFMKMEAGLWSNTAAITSITITAPSGGFVANSSFYLYGISSDTANQNTSGPYAFGGD